MKKPRNRTDGIKGQSHCKNQQPQQAKPDQRKSVSLCIEENQAPAEIHCKLSNPQAKSLPFKRSVLLPDQCHSKTHEGKENGPNNREHNSGRRERRLIHRLVRPHCVMREPCGKSSNRECNGGKDKKTRPFFHRISSSLPITISHFSPSEPPKA